ncbi:ESX secretion-associated protein EspG [Amycolatopsis cihanbeyliensis]|uniref:ESAT-6 protein secretion system EspG family protein n=1 Tax=Amycolatopsis cihanbeyliensis TaxID=1128664 RepID=A0A542CT36_AMYCI|nr:ESX secretion-associated protein EspG [Amycolatopsis cihanbeyliensis]TQI93992.1 ESAT-6 protein secretion system EspG family protein [Amycolatopsis cihanbeyliensis]
MIRVSASAFDILWTDLGYSTRPGPLAVRSVGETEQERTDIRAAVYDNLAERGLFADGRLDPVLEDRLAALATAEVYVECEALVDIADGEPLRAVAAAGGARAVLAVQPRQTIGLSEIRDTELVPAAVGVLPELEPGPGYGISLPAARLGGGMTDPVFDEGGEGEKSTPYQQQAREVLAIQARPVFGAGQFSVRARERGGKVRRLGGVSWFVTDVGAYLGTVAPGRGGQDWMSVAPADSARLVGKLSDILER